VCVDLTASICRVGLTRVPGDLIRFRGELYLNSLRVLFI